jgi:signal transduction histidine kinase
VRSLWSPRSLGLKLGLVLFVIVAGAMTIVYFAIVPRLENRLVDTTYDSLERSVPTVSVGLNSNPRFEYPQVADFFQDRLNARVAVFERLTDDTLVLVADSYEAPAELTSDPILLEAARTGSLVQGRSERDGREFAVVAAPAPDRPGTYVLLAAPLADRLSAINVVRRDLLIFGGIALAASWIVGALFANRHTRRIRRLESAAERIAAGDLEAPIVVEGEDELAELARGLERMRVRLAHLDQARREFIGNASHELRTPLFALGGFLELLADEDLDEATRRDFLETARGQVDRLTRLATDLLDLSRLDADQGDFGAEPVDLVATVAALAEEFGPLAEATDHELMVADGAEAAVGLGDAERVLRVGRALVENALRHTPVGTTVELRASVWVDRAQLSVHDDGPGISSADQERVFERFYRGDGSAPEGSGIGLAIARELAQRMGGTIELRSEPGSTTFTLTLARAPVAAFPRENVLVGEP